MSAERFDELLDQALETGEIPTQASPEERAEIARLLEASGVLRAAQPRIDREVRSSMPIAKARFERFVAVSRTAPAAVTARAQPRRGFLGRLIAAPRGLSAVGAAAAIGLIAVATLFVSQSVFNDVQTASAQVLVPGEYVQVQGVVVDNTGEGAGRRIQVQSEFDRFEVTLSESTSVVDAQSSTDAGSIKPGDSVLVGGVVSKDRRVAASTLALSGQRPGTPSHVKLRELKELPPELIGNVSVLAIAPDGQHGRVLIITDSGERIVVVVDGQSASELVSRFSTALGARVEVKRGGDATGAQFQLELRSEPAPVSSNPPLPPKDGRPMRPDASANREGPAFVRVEGVIAGREGNLLKIQTDRGPVTVVVTPGRTQILVGRSGLTLEGFLHGETATGHLVAITGGLDKTTGHVNADVLAIGPKPGK